MASYKTKLCALFQRGRCPRQNCSFAHGEAELRRHPGGTFHGRRDYRGGDLRERLQRRYSPRGRRFSPQKDSPRGRHGNLDRGHSRSRSPLRGRSSRSMSPYKLDSHRREKKRRVDVPGSNNLSDVSLDPEDHVVSAYESQARKSPPDSKALLEQQLHEVYEEMQSLAECASQAEFMCEEHLKVIDQQSAKISELECRIQEEQEEYRRSNFELKTFVKLLLQNERAQEEMKQTQARLLKLADDFTLANDARKCAPSFGEESDVNVIGNIDGEVMAKNSLGTLNNPLARGPVKDENNRKGILFERSELRGKALSSLHKLRVSSSSRADELEDMDALENETHKEHLIVKEVGRGVASHSADQVSKVRRWEMNLNLPSTGLAAHAEDDDVENDNKQGSGGIFSAQAALLTGKLTSINGIKHSSDSHLVVPTLLPNQYAEYEGDDEDVDVEFVDEDNQAKS